MNYKRVIIALLFLVFIWSVIDPTDYLKWFTAVLPVLVGLGIVWAISGRFKFTSFTYTLIASYCVVLLIGAHYTYAKVPLFNFGLTGEGNNLFGKFLHFVQGFVPVMIIREIFIRQRILLKDRWLNFVIVCACVAINVGYELIEWFIKEGTQTAAYMVWESQNYEWDTQPNLLLATIGAMTGIITLGTRQDRAIRHLKRRKVKEWNWSEVSNTMNTTEKGSKNVSPETSKSSKQWSDQLH